jgi:predicted DNA-binding ribbon-helix-helix protein
MSHDTSIIKWSFRLDGKPLKITLERAFWARLEEAAQREKMTLSMMVTRILAGNEDPKANRSTVLRVWIVNDLHRRLEGRMKQ